MCVEEELVMCSPVVSHPTMKKVDFAFLFNLYDVRLSNALNFHLSASLC